MALSATGTSTGAPAAPTDDAPHGGGASPHVQPAVLGAGLLGIVLLTVAVATSQGGRMVALLAIGLALGVVLFHARFGFTSAWRELVAVGQGRGLRAHALMLAVASALFAPILAGGLSLAGQDPVGAVQPLGVGLVVGAVLFGIGMQLGGSCASGTLFNVGGGSRVMLLLLLFFIVGSTLGAWTSGFWTQDALNGPAISLATDTGLGYGGALAVQLAVLGAVVGATLLVQRRRRPPPPAPLPAGADRSLAVRALRGPWTIWAGAVALGVLAALVLLVRGQPWGITSAFALWGSKVVSALGVDVSGWAMWQGGGRAQLEGSVLADATSVMNFGIILGALVAAAAGGAFVFRRALPWRTVAACVVGGLAMGYGARLAYGCNIGAYFSGIASFSLHGWAWGVLALGGTWIGVRLRPLFGLAVPRPGDSSC